MSEQTDIVIVGAGPCGLAVGAAARQTGMQAVLIDKGSITQSLVDYPTYMSFFSTAEKLEIGGIPFIVAGEKPTRRDALVYYRRVSRHFELDVRQYEEVVSLSGEEGEFRARTRTLAGLEGDYRGRALVLATGSFHAPNRLGVPGEDLVKVTHYFSDALPYFDQDVLVVGGGNSAVEAALELYRAGARVTMVHFAHELDRGVKPWILPDIHNRIARDEIRMKWGARVAEIRPDAVVLRREDGGDAEVVRNDWVFAMTGWHPDPSLLRSMGVESDPKTGVPAYDPATMETNVPGLFIAGVMAAGNDANRIFIENGREHGGLIVGELSRRWA